MGEQAEEAGVEIYPGFSASEVIYREDGSVGGIATRDVGIGKDGKPKGTFARGMELRARVEVMEKFNLREGVQPQTYGIGVKEVWRIPKEKHQAGLVQHTLGWPLQQTLMDKTFGGSFMYHMEDDLVQIGVVVGLDYENPYINPYEEFQRFKMHPAIRKYLEGGECVQYGARCLNEGGYHAIPKLTFRGGGLIGCSAGFLNGVKIKGTHTAMKSGMLAAEAAYEALTASGAEPVAETAEINPEEPAIDISSYEGAVESSWIAEELKAVRNVHAGFGKGFLPGLLHAGVATHVLRGKEPWTIPNTVPDSAKTRPAKEFTPIEYPKPDGKLTFDLLSNLQRSGTNHNHDQPAHLRIKPELADVPSQESFPVYAGPEQRFCPARVYEYTDGSEANGVPQLVINAQNCVHCKCCSIKMPKEYIKWTVQEAAERSGTTDYKAFCDDVSARFGAVFAEADVSCSRFIRTSDADHREAVAAFWRAIRDKGHIYLGDHESWYCKSDESFLTEMQVEDRRDAAGNVVKVSKESGHPVEMLREENYKFRLSAFQDRLLQWLDDNPDVIVPKSRYNEVRAAVTGGLRDLSVSRLSEKIQWAIKHCVYVWLDALTNYLTSAGYPGNVDHAWPADYHIVGKDILKFHAIYWPAFLMAAGLPLPKKVVAHAHWTVGNVKMSKSLGNVVDPHEMLSKYGPDFVRFFLLREGVLANDGDFNAETLEDRVNSELADTLGNLVSRSTGKSVLVKGIVPKRPQLDSLTAEDRELVVKGQALAMKVEQLFDTPDVRVSSWRCLKHHAIFPITI
ncbi:unnamed protein product [Phytophthora fragariaefolia]|uniref:Unnamed protein product n=1 Tax=Phytophthora fragariaefolia TaxID=1490495 RepID=A0A9W6TQ55_9STRA|nr:unnamed protein product [Phytophthora fragariaefolia]